jgi:sister chromatid cohesion protein DCC1
LDKQGIFKLASVAVCRIANLAQTLTNIPHPNLAINQNKKHSTSATEHGWPLDAIPASAAAAALAADGYRAPLVRHCLGRLFGALVKAAPGGSDGSGSGEGNGCGGDNSEPVYALDRGRACLHFARKLLRGGSGGYGGDDDNAAAAAAAGNGGGGAAAPKWRYRDFMAAWAAAVPEEWSPPGASLLAGEALIEAPSSTTDGGSGYGGGSGGERFVEAFAAADLPLEPRARFAALFARRVRWERPDLEPYLAGISGGGGPTVEALLLRHARASQATPDAPVLFSAR